MKLNKKMLFCATLLGGAVLGVEAFTAPTINPFYQCFPNDPCPAGTISSSDGSCKKCAEGTWSAGGSSTKCTSGGLTGSPEQILEDTSYYFEKGAYYKVVIYGATGGGGGGTCHCWKEKNDKYGNGASGGKSKQYTFYIEGNGSNGTIKIGKAGTKGGSYYCAADDCHLGHGSDGGNTYLTYSGVTYKVTGSSGGEGAAWSNSPKPCDEYEGGRTDSWCSDRPFSKCLKSTRTYSGGCSATYSDTEITDSSCVWRDVERAKGDYVAHKSSYCTSQSCNDDASNGSLGYVEIYKWQK